MTPLCPLHLANIIAPSLALAADTQMVVALRLAGLAGLWPVEAGEAQRMIAEKAPLLWDAAHDAQAAARAGGRPDEVLLAALTPLGGAVRANRLRLLAPQA